MNWYVLQVMTGTERDVCTALRRKGVRARAPAQRMEIRRRGQWQTEEQLLLPGDVYKRQVYAYINAADSCRESGVEMDYNALFTQAQTINPTIGAGRL